MLILILAVLAGCAPYHRADYDVETVDATLPEDRATIETIETIAVEGNGFVPATSYVSAATADILAQGQEALRYQESRRAAIQSGTIPTYVSAYAPPVVVATVPAASVAPVACPEKRAPATQAEIDACQNAKLRDDERALEALIKAAGVDNPK